MPDNTASYAVRKIAIAYLRQAELVIDEKKKIFLREFVKQFRPEFQLLILFKIAALCKEGVRNLEAIETLMELREKNAAEPS